MEEGGVGEEWGDADLEDLFCSWVEVELWVGELETPEDAIFSEDHGAEFTIVEGVVHGVGLELDTGFIGADELFAIFHGDGIEEIWGDGGDAGEDGFVVIFWGQLSIFEHFYVVFIGGEELFFRENALTDGSEDAGHVDGEVTECFKEGGDFGEVE